MTTTVLIVDDESEVRQLVRRILLHQGYDVLEAEDGIEAWAVLQRLSGAVQLLVTDIQMPRMDGIALGQKVGADYPGIKVLYISGLVSEPPVSRHQFLPKPFRADALIQCLQGLHL